jgi:hypothetical protein
MSSIDAQIMAIEAASQLDDDARHRFLDDPSDLTRSALDEAYSRFWILGHGSFDSLESNEAWDRWCAARDEARTIGHRPAPRSPAALPSSLQRAD